MQGISTIRDVINNAFSEYRDYDYFAIDHISADEAKSVMVLMVLGTDGANCPIQLDLWRSVYNVTFLQAYFMMIAGGYVGTLFASILAMLASALTHSTSTAIAVPFIVLCAFPFLSRIITLPEVCSFFPDRLLELYIDMREAGLVTLGGKVTTEAVIVPVYAVVCLVLLPVLYGAYKK